MVCADERLQKFRKRVLYGPIFICSCCHQKLFINQVAELTEKLKEDIDIADPEIRSECINNEIEVDLGRNKDNSDIKCTYICISCKISLKKGKSPKLCTNNGLEVDEIEDPELKLTELENNLIARNIIFQKFTSFRNRDGVELRTDW